MSQKVSVPVLPHVCVFLLQYYGKMNKSNDAARVHVERDSLLGKMFEGAMSKVPFQMPNKYVPTDCVLMQFQLSDEFDSLTLTDACRNILGQQLNYYVNEMFGFGGACQVVITQNENLAARQIIEWFGMEEHYEPNSGRHLIHRRVKRINKAKSRSSELKFSKNFSHTRTRKSA